MGLESVVESWVSVLEHHNNSRRTLTQKRLEHEGMVAINGPSDWHCESVVQEAFVKYWGKHKDSRPHWVRRNERKKDFDISAAVDSKVNTPAKVPFMV